MTGKIVELEKRYQSMFGNHPPIFGYSDDELLKALEKALETKTPMRGYDEVIDELSGVVDDDFEKAKKIKI
jgi:hypothetical protein